MSDLTSKPGPETPGEPSNQPQKRRNRPRTRKPRDQRANDSNDSNEPKSQAGPSKESKATPKREPNEEQKSQLRSIQTSGQTSNQNANPKPNRNRARRPVVARPKPKFDDIRLGELAQVTRMYKLEKVNDQLYKGSLTPSDPDFPFDIETVYFDLHLPLDYPKTGPWIKVTNRDIPVGYSANVDLGFSKDIVARKLGKDTLLNMFVELDKKLELFLKQEKQGTIKIIKAKKKPSSSTTTTKEASNQQNTTEKSSQTSIPDVLRKALHNRKVFVPAHVAAERDRQIRMLQTRLKDQVTLFSSSESGKMFRVDIDPHAKDSEILVSELMSQFNVRLYVPNEYPMSGCSITIPQITDVSARNIETNFNQHAENDKNNWTLLSLVNYLSVNLESLILPPETFEHLVNVPDKQSDKINGSAADEKETEKDENGMTGDVKDDISDGTKTENGKEHKSEDQDQENTTNTNQPEDQLSSELDNMSISDTLSVARRGTELRFEVELLTGVAFYECLSLSIQVECTRCQIVNDMLDMSSAAYGKESKPRHVTCKKCSLELVGAFRKDIMHPANSIAGYLDLVDCNASDYLPSNYSLTCENCTQTHEAPIKVGLGKKVALNCYNCHNEMILKFGTFSFAQMSAHGLRLRKLASDSGGGGPQKLKLSRGTPLPNEGTCTHYKKSKRWFRFTCCQKAFACEKCHDRDQTTHPADTPYRMICGTCSFEQNLAASCKFCGHSFDVRHSAFWEGGKGTRNKATMTRKDPRKYKRLPGKKPVKKANDKSE